MERPEGHARDTSKTYWWIKLYEGFFYTKEMKKLRRIAGGAVYTLIYLKMQQIAMKSCGKLYFDGIEDTFAEEIALTIDESPEDVSATLVLLEKMGLAKKVSDDEIYLPEVEQNTGSETKWAGKKREYRRAVAEKKAAAIEVGEDNVLDVSAMCPTDIDIEKEIDIDTEIEKEKEEEKKEAQRASSRTKEPRHQHGEYKNVLLSDAEMEKLKTEFPDDYEKRIDDLSYYMKRTGRSYKDHLAAIRSWARSDAKKAGAGSGRTPQRGSAEDLQNSYEMLAKWAERED